MEQFRQLTGTIQLRQTITGTVQLKEVLTGVVQLPNLTPPVHPSFDGPYEVTPRFHKQTLETKNKTMTDDVTVETIPVYRTINPSGGNTVSIGI